MMLVIISMLPGGTTQALADEDPIRSYNAPSHIDTYNRSGPSGVMGADTGWGYPAGHSAEYRAICEDSGNWDAEARGICYQSGSDSCSCKTDCDSDSDYVSWDTRYAQPGDLSISRINECNSRFCAEEVKDAPGGPNNREISNYRPKDPMLALMPGGDGYLEFEEGLDGEDGGGIHWLSHSGSPDNYLMIPTKGQDYRSMIAADNTSTLTVENACMPASFSSSCPSHPTASCSCKTDCDPCDGLANDGKENRMCGGANQ